MADKMLGLPALIYNPAYSWHLDQKIELIGGTKYLRIDAEKNISILKILPFTIFTLLYPQLEKLFTKERFWNVYLLSVLKSNIHAWSVEVADINGIITRFQRNTEHTKLLHQEMWKKWL